MSRLPHQTAAVALILAAAFAQPLKGETSMQPFGTTTAGQPVTSYTLTAMSGSTARIIDYGATLVSLRVPDRNGALADVVLGFDDLAGYQGPGNPFFGATVGRYANRIAGAKFPLSGTEYKITPTERGNTLHGGKHGFDKVLWQGKQIDDHTAEFSYTSKDGEEGFPGTLQTTVRYSLSDDNRLTITYRATTDKETVINLTNHSYFNLTGSGTTDILGHELQIKADTYTPVNNFLIPTGELADVAGTPFDFRKPQKVGAEINSDHPQTKLAHGYDHNFVLTGGKTSLRPAATLYDPASGREMTLLTTEPGVQLYTGNGLGHTKGKAGQTHPRYGALCLETQHYPDSPNHPTFPTTTLKPGEVYESTTAFAFSTRK